MYIFYIHIKCNKNVIIFFKFFLDLLQFKENPNMKERQPVSYPRNEWFYLEDNRLEAEEEKANSE